MIKSIRKRDGRLVDFEVDKIAGALYKAFSACFDKVELKKVYAIAHDVEKRLEENYTTSKIIDTLKNMNFSESIGNGYIPTYTRTNLTDDLHDKFGFRTDYQIITNHSLKKIFKNNSSTSYHLPFVLNRCKIMP